MFLQSIDVVNNFPENVLLSTLFALFQLELEYCIFRKKTTNLSTKERY